MAELTRLIERVRKIADGVALMTETAVQLQVVCAISNLLGNTPLEKAMHDNLLRLDPPLFDEADRDFARRLRRCRFSIRSWVVLAPMFLAAIHLAAATIWLN